jgi:hypothetical protein
MSEDRIEEYVMRTTDYNHIFRTFLGLPPEKGDKPLCGADLPDSWDFPGYDRPACPACQEVAQS